MHTLATRFGELTIQEEDIYTFARGIPGFEACRRFVFVKPEEHAPFEYLQSVDDGNLAFIVVDPFIFFPRYTFELPDSSVTELGGPKEDSLMIRVIVSIRGELRLATANLVAPVVLNVRDKLGQQVVLSDSEYSVHHRLFNDTSNRTGGG